MNSPDRAPVNEQALAWELAEVVRPLIGPRNRSALFVMLGAGEFRAAIVRVLQIFSSKRYVAPGDVRARIGAWLDYTGLAEELPINHRSRRAFHPATFDGVTKT